jgi:hypothetical protein
MGCVSWLSACKRSYDIAMHACSVRVSRSSVGRRWIGVEQEPGTRAEGRRPTFTAFNSYWAGARAAPSFHRLGTSNAGCRPRQDSSTITTRNSPRPLVRLDPEARVLEPPCRPFHRGIRNASGGLRSPPQPPEIHHARSSWTQKPVSSTLRVGANPPCRSVRIRGPGVYIRCHW